MKHEKLGEPIASSLPAGAPPIDGLISLLSRSMDVSEDAYNSFASML
jgi:hypothetical protein